MTSGAWFSCRLPCRFEPMPGRVPVRGFQRRSAGQRGECCLAADTAVMRVSGDQDGSSDGADSEELLQAGCELVDVTGQRRLILRELGSERLDGDGQPSSFLPDGAHCGIIRNALTPAGDLSDLGIGERLVGIHTEVEASEQSRQRVPLRCLLSVHRLAGDQENAQGRAEYLRSRRLQPFNDRGKRGPGRGDGIDLVRQAADRASGPLRRPDVADVDVGSDQSPPEARTKELAPSIATLGASPHPS